LIESLAENLPPVGSSSVKDQAKTKGKKGKPSAAAPTKSTSSDEPRDVRYDRLYPGKAKLTLDEYLAKQSNADEAKARFTKFDKDKDGFVSREEFINGGK
jgi:hypothetical protein